ncbi:amidase, hydantoinase/carbamoylase family [Pseudodesulfovibrio mercurii]|uniref:Amidase, hydantoinase/carbamoylase family n=1 Tax=Pseudodesulfovibrio mercurii TaxID=641491 RepID=F0JJ99_9BACT|nr:Zn-dependent hydrolase [Pseudodesulfovibrio mercurii]EGB15998.1 amidase, hydantoinase/carbamoylase family [Pseudodesulfovibrio mercurii]
MAVMKKSAPSGMAAHSPRKGAVPDAEAFARDLFDEAARLSPADVGISRPAYSATETRVLEALRERAEAWGLAVRADRGGNYHFALPDDMDAGRFAVVGSHVDSVHQGGNYDGLAGVAAGLLCLIRAKAAGQRFARPVRCIAMRAEESHWFGPCYIGSKGLTGQLTGAELAAVHRDDGRTLESHMRALGIDVDAIRAGRPLLDTASVLEYVELHIEQGPMLVEKRLPVAVVSGIRGNFRHRRITCLGEAGHSGAVPRAYRRDPVFALADLLSRLDDSWLTILQKGDDLVLTSGVVSTDPRTNSLSRIPDKVTFSFDCRSQSGAVLDGMREMLREEMHQVERARRVEFVLDDELSTAPALMDGKVIAGLRAAMARTGLEPFVMPSGGGHDAAVFANAGVPSGMIFVRNRNGSHNPDEALDVADFLLGAEVLYNHLLEGE